MRNKAIIANRNTFADECVRLDPAARTDNNVVLYFDKWPNEAVVAYRTTIKINRFDDRDTRTKLHVSYPDPA